MQNLVKQIDACVLPWRAGLEPVLVHYALPDADDIAHAIHRTRCKVRKAVFQVFFFFCPAGQRGAEAGAVHCALPGARGNCPKSWRLYLCEM